MQGRLDQLRYPLIVDGARRARTNIVIQAGDTALNEASAPLAYRRLGELQPLRDGVVGLAIGAAQDDASPVAQCRRQRAATRKGQQLRTLAVAEYQFGLRPSVLIAVSPFPRYRSSMQD